MESTFSDSRSLDRPAWTSEQNTGGLRAYRHKHTLKQGKFVCEQNYYLQRKGIEWQKQNYNNS